MFGIGPGLRKPLASTPVQIILQDHGRSGSVELRLAFLPVALAQRQPAFGFMAAQPLVLGHNGDRCSAPQPRDEHFDEPGLLAGRPVEAARQPHHHFPDTVILRSKFADRQADAVDAISVGHSERHQGTGERSGWIADCHPDSPTANVQPEYPHRDAIFCRTRMLHRMVAGCVAALALAGSVMLAQTADREQTAALSRRAADRLQKLHEEAERLAADERTLLGDLRRLELDREIRTTELDDARAEVRAAAADLRTLDQQVATLTSESNAALPDLRARLVTLYKLGRGQYARLLLSASDVRQFGQAVRLVSALAEQDRQRVASHQRRLADLTTARAAARERQARVQQLQASAQKAQDGAEQALSALAALVHDIDTRRDLNAQFSAELLTAQERLQASLDGLTPAATVALPLGPFRGDLDWPITGTVLQRFGESVSGRPPTRGIELEGAAQAPVHAVHDGTVAYADSFAGYGRLVILDHGGQTFTLYGNLGDIQTEKGARVERGAQIGTAGLGERDAAVLYFELRVDGRAVDPLQWLTKR